MKHYLLILTIAAFSQFANGQSGIYHRDTTKAKTCFDEYYESFVTRGSMKVPDGEQNVVISMCKDTGCFCGEGKIVVKGGNLVPSLMVKKIDGTYEQAKKVLHPKTMKDEHGMDNALTIIDGMSKTFTTDDFYTVNLFFVDYLKRKVVPNAQAPSPNDIQGKQIELDVKEKEIIKKAYEGLQFETGKATIKSSSYSHLNLLAEMLKEKTDYKINLNGYTDNVGKPESNLTLSKNRANAVRDYLVKQGIDGSRITADGFGIENPIGDNKTSAGRAKNRRVEFIVTQ